MTRVKKGVNGRPPNDRGQGRKPITKGEKSVVFMVRLSVAQREKIELMGNQWLRDLLDNAPDESTL